ncbi:MAG: hypothetical protein A4E19_08200 [Nitrospira sp. SG-bin1]|nr:MAG: hypothetical protein A4E19_08200 [Nitrospira sp. SG-bin1]
MRTCKSFLAWGFSCLPRFVLLLSLSFSTTDLVQADTTVRVVETWPPGDYVTLGKNQNFYLRLAYETDKPVHIWARPYFRGKPANVGSNTSLSYSGTGETFGWFFFNHPVDVVDEVRIMAGDGSDANTAVVAVWRGYVMGDNKVSGATAEPAWVAEMRGRVKAAQDEAYRARKQKPTSAFDIVSDIFFGVAFLCVVLASGFFGLFMPARAVWRWHGAWRIAAAIPGAMMAFVVLRIVVDGFRDPTSHNLFPLEIIMWGSVSTGMMVLLYLAHKFAGGKR